jgi:hypothetical protein
LQDVLARRMMSVVARRCQRGVGRSGRFAEGEETGGSF